MNFRSDVEHACNYMPVLHVLCSKLVFEIVRFFALTCACKNISFDIIDLPQKLTLLTFTDKSCLSSCSREKFSHILPVTLWYNSRGKRYSHH